MGSGKLGFVCMGSEFSRIIIEVGKFGLVSWKKALGLNSFTTNMAASGDLKCIDSSPFRHDSEFILKEEQRNAIKAFVNRKEVFAFLPTGSGKSLIYQLALVTYYVVLIGCR